MNFVFQFGVSEEKQQPLPG